MYDSHCHVTFVYTYILYMKNKNILYKRTECPYYILFFLLYSWGKKKLGQLIKIENTIQRHWMFMRNMPIHQYTIRKPECVHGRHRETSQGNKSLMEWNSATLLLETGWHICLNSVIPKPLKEELKCGCTLNYLCSGYNRI